MMNLCAFSTHNKSFTKHFLLFVLIAFTTGFSFAASSKYTIVQNIKIIGNKVTKDKIILREMPFNLGDTLNNKKLKAIFQQAKDNLLNTSLFNFVTINPLYIDSIHATIYITVTERWYIWPIPVFYIEDTNFNTWLKNRDLSRINIGLGLDIRNFRGRKEDLTFQTQLGYTEAFMVFYHKPYLDKKQRLGLSAQISYTQNHQITYNSDNDKRLYYKNDNHYVMKNLYAGIQLQYRQRLYNHHYFTAEYQHVDLSDSVLKLNPDFLGRKDLSQYFSLSYRFKHDKRDFANYPLKGHFIDFKIVKNGLGLYKDRIDNWAFSSTLKKFFALPAHFFLSGSIAGQYTYDINPVYYLDPKLGYDEYVRAYEYYVIAGQNWAIGKAQLRYGLVSKKIVNLDFIKSEKFNRVPISIYPGIFYDAGYMEDNEKRLNPLANKWIYGEGVSLDFVTYYDLVLRLEYSINMMGESGLFVHFVASI